MRYLFGFLCVCAVVATLPLSVGAQDAEEGATSEPNLKEPAPEEPALEVKLAPAAEHRKTQLRPARIGLAASVVAFGGGVAMMGVAFANVEAGARFCLGFAPCPQTPAWVIPVAVIGSLFAIGGLTGTILSGRQLAKRKKQLRWYAGAPDSRYGRPHRVQWDLARSRLVF